MKITNLSNSKIRFEDLEPCDAFFYNNWVGVKVEELDGAENAILFDNIDGESPIWMEALDDDTMVEHISITEICFLQTPKISDYEPMG